MARKLDQGSAKIKNKDVYNVQQIPNLIAVGRDRVLNLEVEK